MKNIIKYLTCAILLAAAMAFYVMTTLPDGRLHVYMLDVGQGDALLIRTPSDQFILVDGGPDDTVLNELAEVMPFYRRDLNTVILTHPHPDHVNGLVEVVRRYDVKRVVMTGIDYDYAGYTAFLEAIAEGDVQVEFADGKDMTIGGVLLDMVFPLATLQGQTFINANNSSIVFRLIYGNTVFFFAGDCELACEEKIVASGESTGTDLSADVLKVGHHGSRTSSSDAFLDAVFGSRPVGLDEQFYALISVGADNSFKHPHPETVDKLQEHSVRILRTDINGQIELISDGVKTIVR